MIFYFFDQKENTCIGAQGQHFDPFFKVTQQYSTMNKSLLQYFNNHTIQNIQECTRISPLLLFIPVNSSTLTALPLPYYMTFFNNHMNCNIQESSRIKSLNILYTIPSSSAPLLPYDGVHTLFQIIFCFIYFLLLKSGIKRRDLISLLWISSFMFCLQSDFTFTTVGYQIIWLRLTIFAH